MYRAKPVTQRDGSAHQYENCTMASGATLIDFDTLGKVTSTGAEMRSRQNDQSGGTDIGDLDVAWHTYGQDLIDRRGDTFDTALADLRAGRGIVLSVWHATTGGPCLSGSGAYGHAICVAPEKDGSNWLVADPWCSPPKWEWWPESKLRAGAEEWGRRVYGYAKDTGGPNYKPTLADIIKAAKALMTRFHAGGTEDPTPDPGDTGGGQLILFGSSDAHPEDDMAASLEPGGKVKGEDWQPWDNVNDVAKRQPIRSTPDRSEGAIIGYMEVGKPPIRSILEQTTKDGNEWRAIDFGDQVGWVLRSDLKPVTPGGDPVIDKQLQDYCARKPPPACSPTQLLAARKAEYIRVKNGSSVALPPPPVV